MGSPIKLSLEDSAARSASGIGGSRMYCEAAVLVERVPPQAWFGLSAVFHYLGPSLAVLLFPRVGVLGVAWLRIAAAAVVFAPLTRPWQAFASATPTQRQLLLTFGVALAAMNCSFYLALARLPVSLVAAIEFVGTLAVALVGMRTVRNGIALGLAVLGVALLLHLRWRSDLPGLFWAVLNGLLFVVYIVLGHRLARGGARAGIANLGAAMWVAFLVVFPIGLGQSLAALSHPMLVAAALGVGIVSSVIPYVCDQVAMSRLPRASFALLLSLLPACATLIAAIVLRQIPTGHDVLGIALVMSGVALHQPRAMEH
jgi:inner membrane transporter RhtA